MALSEGHFNGRFSRDIETSFGAPDAPALSAATICGIDAYFSKSLVDVIRNAPSAPSVRVHNLCGNQNDIALLHNEHTGPSDGVVFILSCRDVVGITNDGGGATIAVNHMGLGLGSARRCASEDLAGRTLMRPILTCHVATEAAKSTPCMQRSVEAQRSRTRFGLA